MRKLNVALIFLATISASFVYGDTCPPTTNIHEMKGEYVADAGGTWKVMVQTGISVDAMKKGVFLGANGLGPKTCYSGGEDRPCSTVSTLTCLYETGTGSPFTINASSGKRYQPIGWIRTDYIPPVGKYDANMYNYKCVSGDQEVTDCQFNPF